jgi:hypothetical protein
MPKPEKPAREMVETRRLYQFEQVFMRRSVVPKGAIKYRSQRYLQEFASKVWAKHGRKGQRVPLIRLRADIDMSWCIGFSLIELSISGKARGGFKHNTIDVLLHELTHAIGYSTHGRGFVRKYVELLVEYAGFDEGELRLALGLFNIKS